MNDGDDVTHEEIDRLYERLNREAEEGGYHLNPDIEFTKDLVRGLIVNTRRYGYQACPCRLAQGVRADDLDIICPCDYRDPDLEEFGACYCGLYVSQEIVDGTARLRRIPERRPGPGEAPPSAAPATEHVSGAALSYPVWRCRVCGYLCARNAPPGVCPVCKATKDRFERFM